MSLLKRIDSVKFDPSNKEHRAAVRAFMRRKAWVDSSMRFTPDPAYNSSVAEQVQTKLLQWYLDQEDSRNNKRITKSADMPPAKSKPALVEVRSTASLNGIPRGLLTRQA
jgi:hypothetical protein